ncbi:MAG: CRTAC1 family protein [Planctomycetota bacterium]
MSLFQFRFSHWLVIALVVPLMMTSFLGCESRPPSVVRKEKESGSQNSQPVEPTSNDPMTRYMVQQLKTLAEEAVPKDNYHMNGKRLANMKADYERISDPSQKMNMVIPLIMEYLNAGDPQGCLDLLEEVSSLFRIKDEINDQNKSFFRLKALAYLRLGEQSNCVQNHSPESCILPLQGKAIHTLREGSEKAARLYQKLCEFDRSDDQSKWLLNVALMTLGEYPESVPPEFLIEGLEESEPNLANASAFTDIAGSLGINIHALSGGTCVEDFNNDGFFDIMASSWGYYDQIQYYEQVDGQFVSKTKQSGLTGLTGGLNMIHADYNNDGFEDVLVLRGAWLQDAGKHPNSLLKNNGDGTFSDVTRFAGLSARYPTQNAAWADIDLDGDLDLFVGHEGFRSHLYVNQGDGKFKERGAELGLDFRKFVKGCSFGDFNRDGYADLVVSVLGESNLLFFNRNGKFIQADDPSWDISDPEQSFPCWSWDFNNDGWEDLFIACYDPEFESEAGGEFSKWVQGKTFRSDKSGLYLNQKGEGFKKVASEYGLDAPLFAMGSNFGDYNNDGFLDCYIGTGTPNLASVLPNLFFQNQNGDAFKNVTTETRTGHVQKGHGVTFADIDQDGDLDIYAVMGGAFEGDAFQNVLFRNNLGKRQQDNQFLYVKLVGTQSNRSAIGARLELQFKDNVGNAQSIFRTVGTGGSFGSSPLTVHFGLAQAQRLTKLIVHWPNADQNLVEFSDIEAHRNQSIRIIEGQSEVQVQPFDQVDFGAEN